MTVATLSEVLQPALKQGYAVAGLVTLGWEEMRAYVAAAEAEGVSAILMAGPGCRKHTPLPVLGKMLRYLAENASVPIVVQLDHGYSLDECKQAIDCCCIHSSSILNRFRKYSKFSLSVCCAIISPKKSLCFDDLPVR